MSDISNEARSSQDAPTSETTGYPQLAKVVRHTDNTHNGILDVEILRPAGNERTGTQVQQVKMISPFFGYTPRDFVGEEPDYNATQKSYGMWMVPPDVGTIVVVIFINGNPKDGYWLGSTIAPDANFMVPGLAATGYALEDSKATDKERVPVAEFNKVLNEAPMVDSTKIPKPAHPIEETFNQQGLLEDDIRGITTSSGRREVPSMVFGISTPGPLDKQEGAPRNKVGLRSKEALVPSSRLGGSTFVMDDGDDKFIRKKTATEGPPDYLSIEQESADKIAEADVTIPHNELVRIRTRTGHQILMHNSEDLIYIGNSRGTAWIELSSDGKIDIFAEDSISIRTKQDFNFYADRDINFEAKRNVNIKSGARFQCDVKGNFNLVVTGNGKITTTGMLDINTGSTNKFTSGGDTHIKAANTAIDGGNINFNSGIASAAATAAALATHSIKDVEEDAEAEVLSYKLADTPITSILKRIPTHEPWPHHENLDPLAVKFEKTDREVATAIPEPEWYKKYTTITDTFAKIAGEEEEPPEEEEEF
jgi:hypothetical protein